MKRLLGLLLVMGMVGGGGSHEGKPAPPEQGPAVQASDADAVAARKKLGADFLRNDNGDVVTVNNCPELSVEVAAG